MKKNFIILIVLLFAITSCQTNKITIEGRIKDYDVKTAPDLFITSSEVDFNWICRDTINVDSTGSFRIELPIDDDAIFIGFLAMGSHNMSFIAEEGETHSITVDLSYLRTNQQ